MRASTIWIASLGAITIAAAACSDSSEKEKDAGVDFVVSEAGLPDIGPLYDCDTPGQACNAHNACAINPICGADHKCRPTQVQSCDDGLDCTRDTCKGLGVCENTPIKEYCALPVKVTDKTGAIETVFKCFKHQERNPEDACQICNADTANGGDQTKWGQANGGKCDDGDSCTKDDYCQAGVCKGTDFRKDCADNVSCTDDLCDGNGGCLEHKLLLDYCLIGGVCAKEGSGDATGCNICDTKKSQSAWTPLTVYCLINNKCYKPGEKDSTGCASCDPAKNDKDWTPMPNICKIGTACYQPGAKSPGGCGECDPAVSGTEWTVKGNDCMINGTCYKAGTKDALACSICDPTKSKTAWTPLAGQCLIGGMCYAAGAKDPTTCAECDPSVSSSTWTVKGNNCLIANTCYVPGQNDPSGCASCDPTKSKTSWSPLANKCLIGGSCYADQDKDKTGCLYCDYAKQPNAWTPVAGVTSVTYNFEDGKTPANWSITNSDTKVGWVVSNKRPGEGSYSLYYGDPTTGKYDSPGVKNEGDAVLPAVAIAPGKKGGLSFLLWMDVESTNSYDQLEVYAGSDNLWSKSTGSTGTVPKMKTWQQVYIDLSAYAGKSIVIKLRFFTKDSTNNTGEGVYIDQLTLFTDC